MSFDPNVVLLNQVQDLAAETTARLYELVSAVYVEEEAAALELGLTQEMLESISQIMINNYNRFRDGASLFHRATRTRPNYVAPYEREQESDRDDEDLDETEAADNAETDDDDVETDDD
jgi:hypothetical protein